MGAKRILVIGLDGADIETLLKGINRGRLENMAKLVEKGDISTLKSPQPPTTPVSMSSILTGKTPEKHGIFGFETNPSENKGYVTYTDIEEETLFDILDNEGLESITINVPMTSPLPDTVDFGVAGFPSNSKIAKPYPLRDRLKSEDYRVEPIDYSEGKDSFIEDVFQLAEKRFEVAKELWNKEWSLFFLMFTGDARLQHYIDDEETIMDYYAHIDRYIGELASEDLEILVVSDHGFHPLKTEFDIGRWLKEEGYMSDNISNGRDKLYGELEETEESSAYPGGAYLGNIYADEELHEEIVDKLSQLEYKGEKVFRNVFLSEEIYGKNNGPDIIPVPRRGFNYIAGSNTVFNDSPEEKRVPDQEGVIISSLEFSDTSMISSTDILPTILDLFNIEGYNLDGNSFTE